MATEELNNRVKKLEKELVSALNRIEYLENQARLQLSGQGSGEFPEIKSSHSLVKKFLTQEVWDKLKGIRTKTTNMTLAACIACALQFDNQHVGIYAADEDCYNDFALLFDPIIQEYHSVKPDAKHTTDMDPSNLKSTVAEDCPVQSTRIRVGRNIVGYGLSPGITKDQRLEVESLMKEAFAALPEDLQGTYYGLTGMSETDRLALVKKRYLFVSGDNNLQVGGMEREWPEGRGIFVSKDEKFMVWVNEEDQLRIISMQKGADVAEVFTRLCKGINTIEKFLNGKGKKFQQNDRFGYFTSCPTNLGTGMRASVMLELPAWKAEATAKGVATGKKYLQAFYDDNKMGIQARGSRGESGGETGCKYDLSNMHRLGYSEVQLVQNMIDGINKTWELEKQKAKGGDDSKASS